MSLMYDVSKAQGLDIGETLHLDERSITTLWISDHEFFFFFISSMSTARFIFM